MQYSGKQMNRAKKLIVHEIHDGLIKHFPDLPAMEIGLIDMHLLDILECWKWRLRKPKQIMSYVGLPEVRVQFEEPVKMAKWFIATFDSFKIYDYNKAGKMLCTILNSMILYDVGEEQCQI